MNFIKSMLVGIALAAAMAVTPVLAADESADSHALSQKAVQEHTGPVRLNTEQLDSVSAGAAAAAAAAAAASGGGHCKHHKRKCGGGGSAAAAAAAAAAS
jgi:hypothetical protein